jgi:hypothetical protein
LPPGRRCRTTCRPTSIVFEAPDADPDGVFADLVGSFAPRSRTVSSR